MSPAEQVPAPASPGSPASPAELEVVDLCRDLIRIDSSNYGDGSGPGERQAAEYVAAKLAEVGLDPQLVESGPGRTSVLARIRGSDPGRPALVVHGHLDVVPAEASDWQVDPFSGELLDGYVWGRGAVDMKNADAIYLSVIRDRLRTGRQPTRDLVLCFFADEEAGGRAGAHYVVDNYRPWFDGATEAVGEVGGFSYTLSNGRRLYLIETAEKGMAWLRLTAAGRAGHGSMINEDNAVTALCDAVARLGAHRFPLHLTASVKAFLDEISGALGTELDPNDLEGVIEKLGPISKLIGATLRSTANPTMLQAGYKHNVIPGVAHANVDGRFLPGYEDEFFEELTRVLGPDITYELLVHEVAVETEFGGSLTDAMQHALHAEDPGALAVPYALSGGTDAKSLAPLGINCYGFAPLQLPPELDFAALFHGVDERVPVAGLRFGARVFDRFLDLA